jgi:hypothetical protein
VRLEEEVKSLGNRKVQDKQGPVLVIPHFGIEEELHLAQNLNHMIKKSILKKNNLL